MTRNLKALGLALLAVFALSAMVAQAASAHKFKASAYPAYLTGEQEAGAVNKLEITNNGKKLECNTAKYSGTLAEEGEEVTVSAAYEGCFAPGICETPGCVSVNTKGCHFVLTGATNEAGHAQAHLFCTHTPAEGEVPTKQHRVETSIPGCKVFIEGTEEMAGGKTLTPTAGGVRYTNKGGGAEKEDVTIDVTATGIHFTHNNGITCGAFTGGGEGKDTDLISSITLKGYEDEAHTKQIDVTTE